MGILDVLGLGSKTNQIQDFVSRGAVILDVRTSIEYSTGHIKGSKNIPLDKISSKVEELKKLNKPIIACCRSGARSGQATSFLKKQGLEVINGGGWSSLSQKI